jgi:hypothetical protein
MILHSNPALLFDGHLSATVAKPTIHYPNMEIAASLSFSSLPLKYLRFRPFSSAGHYWQILEMCIDGSNKRYCSKEIF